MEIKPLIGTISLPGDKSLSHRAAMFSCLANEDSEFENISLGGDVKSTVAILNRLGAEITFSGNVLKVKGNGLHCLSGKNLELDCGNSGTTLRLLTGLLSGQDVENVSLVGDESLSRRPHDRVIKPLRSVGVDIKGRDGSYTPVVINGGRPSGGRILMEVASAQVKSAVLLSGLYADSPTTVIEPKLTRNHTELMLKAMGVELEIDKTENGVEITIYSPKNELRGFDAVIPGDPSSAAFFGVAASVIPGSDVTIKSVLLNPTRIGWVEVLMKMGANIEIIETTSQLGEVVGDLRIKHSALNGIDIDENISSMVDELPILALAMACAKGNSSVSNASELRVKESDRISLVVDHLCRAGITVEEKPDGYIIEGGNLSSVEILPQGDHRIAMTFGIANYLAQGQFQEMHQEIVSTSFPSFFSTFSSLTAN